MGACLPAGKLTNADLERTLDTSDEWLFDRTGIRERRLPGPGDTTLRTANAPGRGATKAPGGRPGVMRPSAVTQTHRRAGKLRAELQFGRIDEILATGLHAYLTQFLDRVNDLGMHISRDFLIPAAA